MLVFIGLSDKINECYQMYLSSLFNVLSRVISKPRFSITEPSTLFYLVLETDPYMQIGISSSSMS